MKKSYKINYDKLFTDPFEELLRLSQDNIDLGKDFLIEALNNANEDFYREDFIFYYIKFNKQSQISISIDKNVIDKILDLSAANDHEKFPEICYSLRKAEEMDVYYFIAKALERDVAKNQWAAPCISRFIIARHEKIDFTSDNYKLIELILKKIPLFNLISSKPLLQEITNPLSNKIDFSTMRLGENEDHPLLIAFKNNQNNTRFFEKDYVNILPKHVHQKNKNGQDLAYLLTSAKPCDFNLWGYITSHESFNPNEMVDTNTGNNFPLHFLYLLNKDNQHDSIKTLYKSFYKIA